MLDMRGHKPQRIEMSSQAALTAEMSQRNQEGETWKRQHQPREAAGTKLTHKTHTKRACSETPNRNKKQSTIREWANDETIDPHILSWRFRESRKQRRPGHARTKVSTSRKKTNHNKEEMTEATAAAAAWSHNNTSPTHLTNIPANKQTSNTVNRTYRHLFLRWRQEVDSHREYSPWRLKDSHMIEFESSSHPWSAIEETNTINNVINEDQWHHIILYHITDGSKGAFSK